MNYIIILFGMAMIFAGVSAWLNSVFIIVVIFGVDCHRPPMAQSVQRQPLILNNSWQNLVVH